MNKKLTVGIITVPLSPGRKYFKVCGDGYIASSHINWLKRAGIDIVAIPYDTKKFTYYFNRINGLYLPSGGVFASNSEEYYKCCKKFMSLAINANNNDDYFPVWGGCMGMQQMMIIADGRDDMNFLDKFDSFNNLMLPLEITKKGFDSKIIKYIDENDPIKLDNFMTKNITLNNHMMGISPYKFNKCKQLRLLYKIVSWNYDRNGKKFISTIEANEYPFYGVQWHPERSNHADIFAQFFACELNKNKHKSNIKKEDLLEYKKVNCMNYSNGIYNNCNFYWHKKTSEHNKNLCNVLNLGKPVNNSV